MRTEKEIRSEIFQRIKELYAARSPECFVPGSSPVSYAGRVYDEQELISLVDASLDFWLTAGPWAALFEKKLAEFLGVKHCLLTNSGSSANLLAVSALTSPDLGEKRLKPGDEVITTACGFPTTLNPILQNNLVPVFLDVEPGTWNIQADRIADALSAKTRAVMVPHTLGNPVDLSTVLETVQEHDLWLIEDNCDALGSRYQDRYTGTFGHISTFSFYPAHHITMGEGGAVCTNDPVLKKILASFRDWGRDCWCDPGCDNSCGRRFSWKLGDLPAGYDHKYIYSHIGYNLKVTDMQAAIGVEQLKKLPEFIARRKENFSTLHHALEPYGHFFQLPVAEQAADPSWFGFPILVRESAPFTRDDIVQYLESRRIATRMLFGGNLVRQPAYAAMQYRAPEPLVNTDRVMERLFWIGVYPGLSPEKMEYVLSVFHAFFQQLKQE